MDGVGNGKRIPGLKPDVQPRRIGAVGIDQQQRVLRSIVSFRLELVDFFLYILLIALGIDLGNRVIPQPLQIIKPPFAQRLPGGKSDGTDKDDKQKYNTHDFCRKILIF